MAGKTVDEIVVGANGTLRFAPVGTPAPADESAVLNAAWTDAGYLSEDGVTFHDAKTLEVIPVWQLFNPARRIVTERDTSLSMVLRQWNKLNVPFAFGGGAVSTLAAGHFKYAPPSPANIDERALLLDWQDGTKLYRLLVVRGMVTEAVESQIVRTGPMDLPIGFGVNGVDGADPWYLLTNDPAFG